MSSDKFKVTTTNGTATITLTKLTIEDSGNYTLKTAERGQDFELIIYGEKKTRYF